MLGMHTIRAGRVLTVQPADPAALVSRFVRRGALNTPVDMCARYAVRAPWPGGPPLASLLRMNIRTVLVPAILVQAAACGGSDSTRVETVARPEEPRRTAAGDRELREMLAEIAGVRACDQLRGMFRPIRASDADDGPITGTAWLQECQAIPRGTEITLQLAGRGWRWVSRDSEAAGADFAVDTYVRFTFSVELRGPLDAAYAPDSHVFSLWFTPDGTPKTTFEPIGEVDVDRDGLWSSVVGGLATIVGSSPEDRAGDKVSDEGQTAFAKQFAKGISVTIDLCSGEVRSDLAQAPKGEMIGPRAKSRTERASVYPGGVLLHGPVLLPSKGLDASTGDGVKSQLVCAKDAAKLAQAFIDDRPLPSVSTADEDASCPLVHVLRGPASDEVAGAVDGSYQISEATLRLPKLASCDKQARR
jgi:hypothetical protein